MDKRIREYCQHIRKVQIEVLRKDKETQVWYWNLPAMAAVCHDKRNKHLAKGYTHNPQGNQIAQFLETKIADAWQYR